jgi:hypothetical protein
MNHQDTSQTIALMQVEMIELLREIQSRYQQNI